MSSHTVLADLCASQGYVPAESCIPQAQEAQKAFLFPLPYAILLILHEPDFCIQSLDGVL